MASNITLSAGVRQNLLALQNTAALLSTTQNRLATGKKVNSALDNPTNFFTSSALSSRASDLSKLLDSMANGINTVKAADNGLTAITTAVESLKATVTQARQDASFKASAFSVALTSVAATDVVTFSGGAVTGSVNVDVANSQGVRTGAAYTALDFNDNANNAFETLSFSIAANGGTARAITVTATNDTTLSVTVDGGPATTFATADSDAVTGAELAGALNAAFDAAATPVAITAAFGGGALSFTADTAVSNSNANVTVTGIGTTDAAVLLTASFGFNAGGTLTKTGAVAQTVDEIVAGINANTSLTGKVKATNDNGKVSIQNLSTEDLSVVGATSGGVINGDTGAANTATVGGNTVRKNLITQFNDLRSQLDKLADDSSFNGVNLLKGDTLKLVFNEINTSSISIVSQNANGINSSVLGIGAATATEFSTNTSLDTRLDALSNALTQLRSQASAFGSNLSIVQNRQEFTKAMINTLQTGSDTLVLADGNEEAANLLALQTRQQLSTTALSLASQADQGVLRLF
ncbi:MAG: flagellar protein [Xanthobacteraceae bacterium]|nr:flagellar protein [Xanthobacteraceae bacterium]